MKAIDNILKSIRAKIGLEFKLRKYPYGEKKRRIELITKNNINKILDVGANVGQYGQQLRLLGYKGQIISFEPLSSAYQKLQKNSRKDAHWQAHNYALGDKEEAVKINISRNSFSSSILKINSKHISAFPDFQFVDKEDVLVKTLDLVFHEFCGDSDKIFLKIDTQGFEMKVLNGSALSLKKITGIQVEMSLTKLYDGEHSYLEIINHLQKYGFNLCGIEPGITDPITGKLLQLDGIFFKG
jgi:FkbM family methyltransferase